MSTLLPDVDFILQRLNRNKFRKSFRLFGNDLDNLLTKGIEKIMTHADQIIEKKLVPAYPYKDGKQTPMKPNAHPVFRAMHATATCCRTCISKWHNIPKGH